MMRLAAEALVKRTGRGAISGARSGHQYVLRACTATRSYSQAKPAEQSGSAASHGAAGHGAPQKDGSHRQYSDASAIPAGYQDSSKVNDNGLPQYMEDVYDWAYVDPRFVELRAFKLMWDLRRLASLTSIIQLLDRNIVVTTLLFGNDKRLMNAYLEHVEPGMKVWQVAHVYGDLVNRVANKIGPSGEFHLTDVTPIQIEHANRKIGHLPWVKNTLIDAASWRGNEGQAPYDLVCSFFLLHEVPDDKKVEIVDNMLRQLPKGKKAVFVDYHGPAAWHPVRYILKLVNNYLEPFAFALWDQEISSYATHADQFTWKKRTFFGGVYQCVICEHKQQ